MNPRLCIFGEVLFDHFPDGNRVLGGAPFNVAWHLQAFGLAPLFITRIGNDDEGSEIHRAMRDWGMDLSGLQVDLCKPTGKVTVSFQDGEPGYDIIAPCAYDYIVPPEALPHCDLFYHGSLALRQPVSRRTAESLRGVCEQVFVDINLRPPWWERNRVLAMLQSADWVKLNEDELAQLQTNAQSVRQDAEQLLQDYSPTGLIVTRGAKGADLYRRGEAPLQVAPQRTSQVVDTVGAGDAFSAVLLCGLAHNWSMEATLERAQHFASAIVRQRGAIVRESAFYRPFIKQWQI